MRGQTIDRGRFLLLERLGAGGFGHVYKAVETDPLSGAQTFYAVGARCRPKAGSHRGQALSREITIHRLVSDSPNIVTLHRAVADEEYVYMVMDFCPHGDLSNLIDKGLDDQLVKKLFLQLIDALQELHFKGAFHRDLKPQNILLDKNQDVVLADFGISTTDEQGFSCGTTHYMSRECLRSKGTGVPFSNRSSDVWALGIILIDMLTKLTPWNSPSEIDTRFRAFAQDPAYLPKAFPHFTEETHRLLARILDLDPDTRIGLEELRREFVDINAFTHPVTIGWDQKLAELGPQRQKTHYSSSDEDITTEYSEGDTVDRACREQMLRLLCKDLPPCPAIGRHAIRCAPN